MADSATFTVRPSTATSWPYLFDATRQDRHLHLPLAATGEFNARQSLLLLSIAEAERPLSQSSLLAQQLLHYKRLNWRSNYRPETITIACPPTGKAAGAEALHHLPASELLQRIEPELKVLSPGA